MVAFDPVVSPRRVFGGRMSAEGHRRTDRQTMRPQCILPPSPTCMLAGKDIYKAKINLQGSF